MSSITHDLKKNDLFSLNENLISPKMAEGINKFGKALGDYKRTVASAEKFKEQLKAKSSSIGGSKGENWSQVIQNYQSLKL